MPGLPNVQANNEQILNDIQALQQMEQQLFSSLESNPSLTSEQQQTIIEKMNQLSTMRINLYGTLSGINSYYQSALDTSTGTLDEQTIAIGIVESELNQAKERLSLLEQEKNNKIRLVEINTYFGDKYAEHSQLMKIIIFTLIPVIIISLLYTKGILSNTIYLGLIIIVSVIGAYFFWKRFASIIMRDNMNYQEYAFPALTNASNSGASSDPWLTNTNLGTCVGDFCCSPGLIYDSSLNQCVIGTSSSGTSSGLTSGISSAFSSAESGASSAISGASNTFSGLTSNFESFVTESMVNSVLTKKQQGKYKSDYNLKGPQPSNS
jgi:hypothetical protein